MRIKHITNIIIFTMEGTSNMIGGYLSSAIWNEIPMFSWRILRNYVLMAHFSFAYVGCLVHLEGVNRPVKFISNRSQIHPLHCRSVSATLPHLPEILVHSSKSTQRNLDWVNFLASCRVVDHRSTAESGGNTTQVDRPQTLEISSTTTRTQV